MLTVLTQHWYKGFQCLICSIPTAVHLRWWESHAAKPQDSQDGSEVSVHDVEDKPWPYDKYTETALGNALGSGVHAQRIRPMSLKQVCQTHLLEYILQEVEGRTLQHETNCTVDVQ